MVFSDFEIDDFQEIFWKGEKYGIFVNVPETAIHHCSRVLQFLSFIFLRLC